MMPVAEFAIRSSCLQANPNEKWLWTALILSPFALLIIEGWRERGRRR